MLRSLRAAVAAAVLGSGILGQRLQQGYATFPVRDRIFVGLQTGLIYTSADGGSSWQEVDAGLPNATEIVSLAVAPDGRTLYAGTSAGVYVSDDGGQRWRNDNGGDLILSGDQIRSVVVSPILGPGNAQMVYAATRGGSVGRSSDGGAHWQVEQLPGGRPLITLALDTGRPSTLLASTFGDGRLLLSTDAGLSWGSPRQNIPPYTVVDVFAVSPVDPDVLFAGTNTGIYKTLDGGHTWQGHSRGLPAGITITALAIDPLHGTHVLAADYFGHIYRSLDGGISWLQTQTPFQVASSAVNALLYDPARPGSVVAGLTGSSSIATSTDQGASWSESRNSVFSNSSALCLAISLRPGLLTDPVAPPTLGLKDVHYFSQTGHTVRGTFYKFYQQYGGLKIFGLPLTEAFTDHGQVVQYLERARLALTTSGVRESPLGSLLTAGRTFPPAPLPPITPSYLYFGATGHWIAGPFLEFWTRHHGQLLFGDPISEPLPEQNGDGTGRAYQVQYFQNARLEYHPELAGTDNEVQLGLLGRQYLQKLGIL